MDGKMPEKIYIFDYNDAMVTRIEGDTVYVREDAFIEKACDYLMEYEFNDSTTIADRRKRVEDFKNYLKYGKVQN